MLQTFWKIRLPCFFLAFRKGHNSQSHVRTSEAARLSHHITLDSVSARYLLLVRTYVRKSVVLLPTFFLKQAAKRTQDNSFVCR